jgi:hypothetical protein
MHYYLVKLAVAWALVTCANLVFRVSFSLPVPRTHNLPDWVAGCVEFFETRGWTLIVAMVLAGVWQIAEKH